MSREIRGIFYMFYAYLRPTILSFWGILIGIIAIMVATAVIILMATNGDSKQSFTLGAPVYVFTPILAFMIVYNVIPYLIKQGATRFRILVSTIFFIFMITILNVLLLELVKLVFVLFGMENNMLVLGNGKSIIHFNHVTDFLNISAWHTILFDITVPVIVSGIVFIIALVFYRFGKIIALVSLGLVGALFTLDMMNEGLVYRLLEYFFTHFHVTYFYYGLLFGVVIYLCSYIFLYKMPIKN